MYSDSINPNDRKYYTEFSLPVINAINPYKPKDTDEKKIVEKYKKVEKKFAKKTSE